MAEAAAGAPAPVDVPTTSARAVLAYDTTGDGHLDAFDINQDGEFNARAVPQAGRAGRVTATAARRGALGDVTNSPPARPRPRARKLPQGASAGTGRGTLGPPQTPQDAGAGAGRGVRRPPQTPPPQMVKVLQRADGLLQVSTTLGDNNSNALQ
jgi:hypothetical protein